MEIEEFPWEHMYESKWKIDDDDDTKESEIDCIVTFRSSDSFSDLERRERRNRIDYPVRRNIFRSVAVILDLSYTMNDSDLKPSRLEVVVSQLKLFIKDFFYNNSLSSLCIIVSHDRKAFQLTPLSRHIGEHLRALDKLSCSGNFSLQNSLDMAINATCLSAHFTKEIICIISSLNTSDPGDIYQTFYYIQKHVCFESLVDISISSAPF